MSRNHDWLGVEESLHRALMSSECGRLMLKRVGATMRASVAERGEDMKLTPCDLYRALLFEDYPTTYSDDDTSFPDGFIYPRWQYKHYIAKVKRNGRWVEEPRVSRADVKYENDGKVKPGGGTSLFDCDGWFGFAKWHYFRIPKGIEVPRNLHLEGPGDEQTNASKTRTAHHYQIEVKIPMTTSAFKGSLDNFLRAAIARNVELAHSA